MSEVHVCWDSLRYFWCLFKYFYLKKKQVLPQFLIISGLSNIGNSKMVYLQMYKFTFRTNPSITMSSSVSWCLSAHFHESIV